MQKIDFTGLSPEQIEYISTLEKVVENQQIRINQLTDLLVKSQKALYGQSSEKRRYVFGEDNGQLNPYMYLVHLLTNLPSLKELTHESLTPYLPWSPELPSWCCNDSCKAP